ncbi:signal peptide peptidase SppA [Sphingopyxis yananensis]|uniref:signal peptide peptidase SppA n=1 Tax=Sphingopyxis yananensis TaxID=2886687 RepID=UPI0038998B81|nr:signal peptide peptidase SppA [Sphingopyxis yananensis]
MTMSEPSTPMAEDGRPPWRIPVAAHAAPDSISTYAPRPTSFPRKVWGVLVGIKDGLALLFLLLFFLVIFAALTVRPTAAVSASSGALLVKLNGTITEQLTEPDPMAALSGSTAPVEFRTRDVVQALRSAADDSRITSVVLDLDQFQGGGQVSLSEIGTALDVVRAKKPVLAFATAYSADSYQLAAHASEIWADPNGGVMVAGPGGSSLYYKGLLDRLGVTANIYRVGTFKSAVEPFLRSDQSPEAKQANQAYADTLWQNWKQQVSKARPKAQIDDFTQNMADAVVAAKGDVAKASLNAALVDKLGGRIAFGQHVAKISGSQRKGRAGDFQAISLANWVSANPVANSGSAIAVIPVVGTIVDGVANPGSAGGATISKYILDAVEDDSVKALVLRVDSPGGSVLASEDIRQALLAAKAKKLPVVVSMANLAASGGYWISTPADHIVADPSTITGSIGVFGILPSFEKTLAKIGVTSDGVATTPMSGQPDLIGGTNGEFNRTMQAGVEHVYGQFTGLVAQSRKQPIERIEQIAEGRVWAGSTAKQLGLVDELGGLDRALAIAARMAKQNSYHAKYFEKTPSTFSVVLASLLQKDEDAEQQLRRDLFGLASAQQSLLQQRLFSDLKLLTSTGSVQAMCLECRSYQPSPVVSGSAAAGQNWLLRLMMQVN